MQLNPAVKEMVQAIHQTTAEQAEHKLKYNIFDIQQSTPFSSTDPHILFYTCGRLALDKRSSQLNCIVWTEFECSAVKIALRRETTSCDFF